MVHMPKNDVKLWLNTSEHVQTKNKDADILNHNNKLQQRDL